MGEARKGLCEDNENKEGKIEMVLVEAVRQKVLTSAPARDLHLFESWGSPLGVQVSWVRLQQDRRQEE